MPQCFAYGCKIRRGQLPQGVSFHRFPRDVKMCTEWVVRCGREVGNITKFVKESVASHKPQQFLCSQHFEENQFELNYKYDLLPEGMKPPRPVRKLLKDAVPTIFGLSTDKSTTAAVGRLNRRRQKMLVNELISTPQPTLEDIVNEQLVEQCTHRVDGDHPDAVAEAEEVPEPNAVVEDPHEECATSELVEVQVMEATEEVVQAADSCAMGPVVYNGLKTRGCQTRCRKNYRSVAVQTKFGDSKVRPTTMIDAAVQFPELERSPLTDHNYSKVDTGIQIGERRLTAEDDGEEQVGQDNDMTFEIQGCSTPVQIPPESMQSSRQSESSMSTCPNDAQISDPDWRYTSEMSSSESDEDVEDLEEDERMIGESKFIVFESCLDALLLQLTCPECRTRGVEIDKSRLGSLLSVKVSCIGGHEVVNWQSQPMLGRMPAGNLLLASSILFSGSTYAHIGRFCAYLGLEFISETTFYSIQRKYLFPVLQYVWMQQQNRLLANKSGQQVRIGGDGRCDSPGYSAKYCCYSMMDLDSGHIVEFALEQVCAGVSSVSLEKKAFKKCMFNLKSRDVKVALVATDRHPGIRCVMRKEFPDVDHQFDVWHMGKNLVKKITAAGKLRGRGDLLQWCHSISNHLWWCADTCQGDDLLLKEKWMSLIYHVKDQHSWSGYEKYSSCEHEMPITDGGDKKWLAEGDDCYSALTRIVTNKKFLTDMKHITKFCHTGNLEVFHALLCKYCPKFEHFSYAGMKARIILAILDHNENLNRKQAVVQVPTSKSGPKGELRYQVVYPKSKQDWVAKPIFEKRKYDYIYDLMMHVVRAKRGILDVVPMYIPTLPKNIAKCERPEKTVIIGRHLSRFGKMERR